MNLPDKHSQIRGWILRILMPKYPYPVDSVLMRRTLGTFGHPVDDSDLCTYLSYLKERGYITLKENTEYGFRMAAITADGIDIVDGRQEDAGVFCG